MVQWEILLGVGGLIFSVIFMHFNMSNRLDAQSQRIDAQGQRIDKCIEDNNNLHKEFIELLKMGKI